MNGAGNDFIVIDNRFYHFSADTLVAMAPRICVRRHGIGADGLLAMEDPASPDAAFRMLYYNADGTEGTMCGNGARCLARFAVSTGMPPGTLKFDTASGPCTAVVPADQSGVVRLHTSAPDHWRSRQRLAQAVPGGIHSVHFLWTGTEHVVCFVDDVSQVPVMAWGRRIRCDKALAPLGANINFVQVDSPSHLTARTFEKGVEAETLACGTGAMASALAARYLGYLTADIAEVAMPGGTLRAGVSEPLFLEGPAATVYRGTFEL